MYLDEQQEAIHQAQLLLKHVGLQPADMPSHCSLPSPPLVSNSIDLSYVSPSITYLTSEEILSGKGQLTRQTGVCGIIDHPLGAILEFPETGGQDGVGIAHHFEIDPYDFINPKDNIQYSLGGSHLGHNNVSCCLLFDKSTKQPALCNQLKLTCCSIKKCSFNT
ncbi:hypothetical protein Clacol_006799 [Clathrus columnatus]|uniref:Uncharacterized protein n=1 Tax=Clathrus columnatus TaxID=1419009 RepID=A0AAV5AD34_9AGAM|nr:hypothetical protein Clacol_006799 [Clathrus columnatus]